MTLNRLYSRFDLWGCLFYIEKYEYAQYFFRESVDPPLPLYLHHGGFNLSILDYPYNTHIFCERVKTRVIYLDRGSIECIRWYTCWCVLRCSDAFRTLCNRRKPRANHATSAICRVVDYRMPTQTCFPVDNRKYSTINIIVVEICNMQARKPKKASWDLDPLL